MKPEEAKEKAQKVITDWHDYEKWYDPSMMPIPPFSGAQEEELTRLIASELMAVTPSPSASVQSTARGVELNMNDKATVRLTAKGLEVWMAHWKHNPYASAGASADNLITTELWNLFSIFGSHLYNGCEIPFADNKIVIKAELSTSIEE